MSPPALVDAPPYPEVDGGSTDPSHGDGASVSAQAGFRLRLLNIDHVLTRPGPLDRTECAFNAKSQPLQRVPVLRIFGATPAGQRVCLHVHGVFPYCYVEYKGSLHPDQVLSYIYRLGRELNHAIAASLRRNPFESGSTHFIAAIHLCKGVPFYGYHVGWRYFLKISFVDPTHNVRLQTVLQSGRVMGTVFQPFEVHIRYQLQFMLDYNVFGCDYLDLDRVSFRQPLPENDAFSSADSANNDLQRKVWTQDKVPADWVQADTVGRASYCELEADARAVDIVNRSRLRGRDIHHDFDEDEALKGDEKRVSSLTSLWEEERRRRLNRGLDPSIPKPDTAGEHRKYRHGIDSPRWQASERLEAALRARFEADAAYRTSHQLQLGDFAPRSAYDPHIATTFESVDLMHHHADDEDAEDGDGEEGAGAGAGAGKESGRARRRATGRPATLRSKLFDLEHTLTQAHRSQPTASATSVDTTDATAPGAGVGAGASPFAASFNAASHHSPSDASTDLHFFATQQFLDAMDAAEEQLQRQEAAELSGDEEAAAGAGGGGVDSKDAAEGREGNARSLPQTPQRRRRDEQGESPWASDFIAPDSRGSIRSSGSTSHRIVDLFATPRKDTPAKRSADSATADVTNPRMGSGAEALRLMLEKDWEVREDSPPAPAGHAERSRSGGGIEDAASASKRRQMTQVHFAEAVAGQALKMQVDDTVNGLRQDPESDLRGGAAESDTYLPSSSNGVTPPSPYTAAFPSSTPAKRRAPHAPRRWQYAIPAPTSLEVTGSFELLGLVQQEYLDPFYSQPSDVPRHAREYAGRSWKLGSHSLRYLADFEERIGDEARARGGVGGRLGSTDVRHGQAMAGPVKKPWYRYWEYSKSPPHLWQVESWAQEKERMRQDVRRRARPRSLTQKAATGNSTERSLRFKVSQRQQPSSLVEKEKQHMTVLALEVLACSRGVLQPDPAVDRVEAVLYSFQNEDEGLDDTGSRPGLRTGVLLLRDHGEGGDSLPAPHRLGIDHLAVDVLSTELDLFNALIDLVRTLDPEILVGWEIHHGSWGYIVERAARVYDFHIVPELGRVKELNQGRAAGRGDSWGYTQTSAITVTGRHVLNAWRLMRGELALNQYTYENVVLHLLRRRVPRFSAQTLTNWYRSGVPALVSSALRYWLERTETDLEILDASEIIFRTAEFARIYGVDFFSVISRGSQFKVESVMFRIAKPESYLLPSPNRQQVGEQNAAEDLPLIMEPQSAFYKSPLLVLDFQSLYPSVMIAYNICYSTCLGRVSQFREAWKLGFVEHAPPEGLLSLLKDDVFVSPNGLMYVKPHVRRSLLAKMLTEILDTRVMVKGSMKGVKDKAFRRQQNARQLSLKLLANVTYGYTSASFSGRMPCVEMADSIVQYGRETLERAIQMIHSTPDWGAQVVYGDTDSLFIYLDGRSKDEAFRIGNEIADAVTRDNPQPIKLKFEKVYLPSVLLAKKRYVGFMYETPEDIEPEFNAKGIETVRRDGFPAQQRMVEACIRILFRTQDLSLVKEYCQRQWRKILEGRVSFHEFIYAKEVRLGGYSENGVPPPGAAVATRKMFFDRRLEPQHAERVPYIITQGEPRSKQNDRAVAPEAMLANPALQVDGRHYIERGLIPPLSRIFNLLGVDVAAWFAEMPRVASAQWSMARLVDDDTDEVKGDAAAAAEAARSAADGTRHAGPAHEAGVTKPSARFVEAVTRSGGAKATARHTLTDHYRIENCLVCGARTPLVLGGGGGGGGSGGGSGSHQAGAAWFCTDCRAHPAHSLHSAASRLHIHERRLAALAKTCASCASLPPQAQTPCVSLDCPSLYERVRTAREARGSRVLLRRLATEVGGETEAEACTKRTWQPEKDESKLWW